VFDTHCPFWRLVWAEIWVVIDFCPWPKVVVLASTGDPYQAWQICVDWEEDGPSVFRRGPRGFSSKLSAEMLMGKVVTTLAVSGTVVCASTAFTQTS
jgi:hypothetical protein